MGYHDSALICINGHVINQRFSGSPEFNHDFCDKCGAPTVHQCPYCEKPIKGDYICDVVVIGGSRMDAPPYCGECGEPFPWTQTRLAAARELIDEMEELDQTEKEKLSASLDHLIVETPRSEVAALRTKKLLEKAGKSAVEGFKKVSLGLLTEAAKRSIWG